MTIVYSRLQATETNYKEKISKELDEDNNGLLFDFSSNTDDNNIINVEYSGKLIALVEKQGGNYIIERVSGTPQPSEAIPQETEHGGDSVDMDTQKTHTGTGGDVIRLTPHKDNNIIRVNFG